VTEHSLWLRYEPGNLRRISVRMLSTYLIHRLHLKSLLFKASFRDDRT